MNSYPEPDSNECPHCGGAEYVIRLRVTGVIEEAHRFDGKKADNTELWDGVDLQPIPPALACRDCRAELPVKTVKRVRNRRVKKRDNSELV